MEQKDTGGINFFMIQPDFNLLLWIMLVSFLISAIASIIAGACKIEKQPHYGNGDLIVGLIELFIIAWVIFK